MKVLVFNSSPFMDKGNTSMVLNPFIEGMKEEGAEVETFYLKKLEINPCQGEMNCWLRTPGECFQNDDMKKTILNCGGLTSWFSLLQCTWTACLAQ